jgi:type IV secretion system protein VirD4
MSGVITLLIFLFLIYLAVKYVRRRGRPKYHSERRMKSIEVDAARAVAESLGATPIERLKAVEAEFEARNATLSSTYYGELKSFTKGQRQAKKRYAFFTATRSLANMDNRELTYLGVAELLNAWEGGNDQTFRRWRTALLWGDGKGSTTGKSQWLGFANDHQAVESIIREGGMTVDQVVGEIQRWTAQRMQASDLNPDVREYLAEFSGKTAASGAGAWLKSSHLGGSPYAQRSGYPLYIGSFPDGTRLTYSGDGSIATVAAPGSGKTQCNVFPNLLSWMGPAVVLDISGDIYEHTAGWRAANVGPVFKFSPLEPTDSDRYNPLTFVRADPDYIWEDSRLLAEMMIVPALTSDPFWENEARTVLTAAIAHVCYANPPDQRPMHSVLDVLFGGKPWKDMILGLSLAVDVRVMVQHSTSLAEMNEKTLSSVLQTARSSLGAWSGERIARATATSDWSPLDLRAGNNPTVYIYIRPNEVEAYLSLLRVFIGQHIRMLTGGPVPAPGSPPILFMLDELPRLRNMPPVDEALNIGRKYGLRLWLFAQSVGQLQNAYDNADGMLGSCAVRIYMNPSGADGLADKVSEELGYVESLQDNTRRRLVEAAVLAGPEYRDRQIVIGSGAKPAVVSKDFAYLSSDLQARMAMPVPGARAALAGPATHLPLERA